MNQLTLRGRCFLGAGVAVVLCGMQLGQPDFVRIGVLALVVPLASWLALRLRNPALRLTRSLPASRVEAGETARVALRVTAGSDTPVLLVEERLPEALGSRRDFTCRPLAAGESAVLGYTVRPARRGRHPIGPTLVHRSDVLGMADVTQTIERDDAGAGGSLLVTPRTEVLPSVPLSGRLAGTGDLRARDLLGGGTADVITREYRVGDDLRRVHWPTSARTETLQVRREEQDWQLRCTLLLDNRRFSHRGGTRAGSSTFEASVSAAASLVRHLSARGFEVHLVTADGPVVPRGADGGAHLPAPALLEQLALLGPARDDSLHLDWLRRTRQGGLLLAVLGRLEGEDRGRVADLAAAADAAYAVVHDLGDGGTDETVTRLRRAGWRAVDRAPGAPLAPAWQELLQ